MSSPRVRSEIAARPEERRGDEETTLHQAFRRFRRHRLALGSLAVLVLLALLSLFAPLLTFVTGYEFDAIDLRNRFARPSSSHWLGTDELGHDVFTRVAYGGQVSLAFGLTAALASALIGVTIGSIAGYYGGFLDSLLMRFTDAFLSLPILPLMIILSAVDLEKVSPFPPGDYLQVLKLIVIVVFFNWMTVARLVRGSVLSAKTQDFVEASRALGAGDLRILVAHILPNCIAPILVAATLSVGSIILYESVLSFLGLGIVPPTPSWGNMLHNAQEYLRSAPWLAFFPGSFILLTVISFNFLGDGLRDALDPHQPLRR